MKGLLLLLLLLLIFSPIKAQVPDTWELVVISYNHKDRKERTIVYSFSSYSELKDKIDFIVYRHKPKGSIKRLLFRENNKFSNDYYIIVVSK